MHFTGCSGFNCFVTKNGTKMYRKAKNVLNVIITNFTINLLNNFEYFIIGVPYIRPDNARQ